MPGKTKEAKKICGASQMSKRYNQGIKSVEQECLGEKKCCLYNTQQSKSQTTNSNLPCKSNNLIENGKCAILFQYLLNTHSALMTQFLIGMVIKTMGIDEKGREDK